MSRYKQDSASLIRAEQWGSRAVSAPRPAQPVTQVQDGKSKTFNDPGHAHGPSILNPHIYEALRRKGYSKEKAARISNSK